MRRISTPIIAEHAGRAEPMPSLLLLNGAVVIDQAMPLAGLISGLAGNHMPTHAQQLLDLRTTIDATA